MSAARSGRSPKSYAGKLVPVLLVTLILAATTPLASAEDPPAPATPGVPTVATPPPVAAPPPTPAPSPSPDAPPPFKITGLVYGDYYDVLRSHRDGLEAQNGFWLRRVYIAYEQPLSKSIAMRVRFETNNKGNFKSTSAMNVYLKDAWLKWTYGTHALSFGLAPTPNIEFMDAFQGYRAIERSPFDLYKWDSSRDLGVLAQGRLGGRGLTQYAFQLANGSGTGSETNASKSVRGQLVQRLANGLAFEGYADWQDRPSGRSWSTLEATIGWQRTRWRASLQYGRQQRRGAQADGSDLVLRFVSAFAASPLASKATLVVRADRVFDAVPTGETLDYFPLSDRARLVFGYVGVDFAVSKAVHVIPNVEIAAYDRTADGTRPRTDVMPRVTLFYSW